MDTINLDNNYYLMINTTDSDNNESTTDINNLKLSEIRKKKILFLKVDFNAFEEKEYKKILRQLLYIKQKLLNKIEIGIAENEKRCIGILINYNKDKIAHNDFISGINAILYESTLDRYNYIYDTVCNYLDNQFYGKNLCDFKENKCGEKRNTNVTVGCCRHFRIKRLGPLTKLVECEYLKDDHTCGAKCIGCKLFTCDYLQRKNIKFKIKDILLLDTFFNPIQKYFIKYKCFTPKEKVIKILIFFNM